MKRTATAILLVLLGGCGSGQNDGEPTQRQQIGQTWKYETRKDPASGHDVALAYIGSANSVKTMTAPDSFSVILLQKLRSGETGVTIKSVGSPFTCDLSDCSVQASLDGKATETWHGRMADTKDGVELPPSQKAFEAIASSRTVKVVLDLGAQGTHSFTFDTAGFKWPAA